MEIHIRDCLCGRDSVNFQVKRPEFSGFNRLSLWIGMDLKIMILWIKFILNVDLPPVFAFPA
jgi:hypothetical protein